MSGDEYSLACTAVDGVKYLWVNNARTVTPSDVGRTVFKLLWDRFGSEAQLRYLRVAKETLSDMVETEFHTYLRPVPHERDKWKLLEPPESVGERNRTRAYQQFGNVVRDYKDRRRTNREYARRHPSQISLEDVPGFGAGIGENEDAE